VNTTLQCFNETVSSPKYPFAREEVPIEWTPGADKVADDRSQFCQRKESVGEDYRGTTNTVDGSVCQFWNVTSSQVRSNPRQAPLSVAVEPKIVHFLGQLLPRAARRSSAQVSAVAAASLARRRRRPSPPRRPP
jgi:hypothetical protein